MTHAAERVDAAGWALSSSASAGSVLSLLNDAISFALLIKPLTGRVLLVALKTIRVMSVLIALITAIFRVLVARKKEAMVLAGAKKGAGAAVEGVTHAKRMAPAKAVAKIVRHVTRGLIMTADVVPCLSSVVIPLAMVPRASTLVSLIAMSYAALVTQP